MPTVDENAAYWGAEYEWPVQGDEWSSAWGGASMHWQLTLLPRLRPFLPAKRIVEIAPGQGRWTPFLLNYCDQYVGVDLSESCITTCNRRFAGQDNARFFVNDGKTLPMIESKWADLVFSFDSLVHVEADTMRSYICELNAKLSDDGVAFLHHSNRGDPDTAVRQVDRYGERAATAMPALRPLLRRLDVVPETHWRGPTMSATLMEAMCAEEGLRCVGQEIVTWGRSLIDCLSVVVRPGAKWDRTNVVVRNPNFMGEALSAGAAAKVFGTFQPVS